LDWKALAELAQETGVSPHLFFQIRQLPHLRPVDGEPATELPPAVRRALRRDYASAAARKMAAEEQLAQVLEAMTDGSVTAMVLKGPTVASLYPDPAARAFVDLDILIPPAQLDQAEAALGRLGYRSTAPRSWALEHGYHLPPMKKEGGLLPVEIHWRLAAPHREHCLPVDDFWARAVPWRLGAQRALQLEAVDAALYLCWHEVMQNRVHLGLRALCDLAFMTSTWEPVGWDMLVARAGEYSLQRPVYLMLVLAGQALGLAVPAHPLADLQATSGGPFPEDLVERLLLPDGKRGSGVPVAALQAGAKVTPLARLRHIWWHLFLPRAGMARVYGVSPDSARIYLTYLWRPVDLLRRYGHSTWQAVRGDPVERAAWQREAWLEQWLRGAT
jgi:hypothetical protein